jgi:ribosomal protein S18 acetylase RimI-like enzyme
MTASGQGPLIRRAASTDAEQVARIGRLTFAESFGRLYPSHDLDAYLDQAYSPAAVRAALEDPAFAAWLVATPDGLVVGHALAGPCSLPHADVTPACGELKRLYLLKAWQGRGWGSRLLRDAIDWLERDGPRTLWIGVWSQNLAARRLYSRIGFAKVGEYQFQVGRSLDREFILQRKPRLLGELGEGV